MVGIEGVLAPPLDEESARWVEAIAKDLRARGAGKSLVISGDGQPPVVHALALAINDRLGNIGSTVFLTEPLASDLSSSMPALERLTEAINAGDEIDTLIILGGNPAYTAPANVPFARRLEEQLRRPRERWLAVHLGPYFDETARLCHWHVPEAHFLEQWGDAVAFDGTASIVQPLIAPLYGGRSPLELLAALTPTGEEYEDRSPYDLVRAYWKTHRSSSGPFEPFWQQALHDGIIPGTQWETVKPPLAPGFAAGLPDRRSDPAKGKGYDLIFAPDPTVHDGRFANNGWLQELPKPITMLTWDNALFMSPKTAETLGVRSRPSRVTGGSHGRSIAGMVRLRHGRRTLDVAIWELPGHADGAVTLHLGYGRTRAGRTGSGTGFNAYTLRPANEPWALSGVEITPLRGREYTLACTQAQYSVEGRDVIRSANLTEYQKHPSFATDPERATKNNVSLRHAAEEVRHDQEKERNGRRTPLKTTLYPNDHAYTGYKWGMAIDLSACTGCAACVVACQAENNSPVVGKEQVTRGREMHWLRIDRYFETPAGQKEPNAIRHVHHQPMPCQHCETAPCELVCPVEATVHGDEGTNDMVYNRCVGTRYCLNNCPYKVRRFNFLQYANTTTPSLRLLYNPDVTVRSRGVMEKCTFCIQRISYARIEASKEALDELHLPAQKRKRRDTNGDDGGPRRVQGREVPYIRDGEVVTACQAACPAEAIVFGDLNDKQSRVHKLHESNLRYDLLGELGTRPRVGYLAGLRNPNPSL
jgi:molybdopterin-containing oxidoreductase family iron-sulfur binding subunit